MMGCCWNAMSGIGSIAQAILTGLLLWFAWKKSNQACKQWDEEKAVRRSKFLESLLDRFGNDGVQALVLLADDSVAAQKWLREVLNDKQKEMEAQSSFRFFSYLCYLVDNKLITEREFVSFESALKEILSNEQVQEYFRIIRRRGSNDEIPLKNLLEYAVRNHIDMYAVKEVSQESGCAGQNVISEPADYDIIKMNAEKPPLTAYELSQHPIVVIRINRLYRPDMSRNELYDTTRGWWRVNLEMANKARYALSVAEGCVKEVYAIKGKWHKYGFNEQDEGDGSDGRYQFDGEVVKNDPIRRLYVGRSTEGLFKQGDAYPIRYFGVK